MGGEAGEPRSAGRCVAPRSPARARRTAPSAMAPETTRCWTISAVWRWMVLPDMGRAPSGLTEAATGVRDVPAASPFPAVPPGRLAGVVIRSSPNVGVRLAAPRGHVGRAAGGAIGEDARVRRGRVRRTRSAFGGIDDRHRGTGRVRRLRPVSPQWWPSRYGADDELGAGHELTPERTLAALRIPKQGRIIELAQLLEPGIPAYPPRAWHQLLLAHDDARGAHARSRARPAAVVFEEHVTQSYQIGCHLDGLGHVGVDRSVLQRPALPRHLHADRPAAARASSTRRSGWRAASASTSPPSRGRRCSRRDSRSRPSTSRRPASGRTSRSAPATSCCFHTGWSELWMVDNERYGGARARARLGRRPLADGPAHLAGRRGQLVPRGVAAGERRSTRSSSTSTSSARPARTSSRTCRRSRSSARASRSSCSCCRRARRRARRGRWRRPWRWSERARAVSLLGIDIGSSVTKAVAFAADGSVLAAGRRGGAAARTRGPAGGRSTPARCSRRPGACSPRSRPTRRSRATRRRRSPCRRRAASRCRWRPTAASSARCSARPTPAPPSAAPGRTRPRRRRRWIERCGHVPDHMDPLNRWLWWREHAAGDRRGERAVARLARARDAGADRARGRRSRTGRQVLRLRPGARDWSDDLLGGVVDRPRRRCRRSWRSGRRSATLAPARAAALGLPAGIVVGTGSLDTSCGALGGGAAIAGVVGLAVGSWESFVEPVDAPPAGARCSRPAGSRSVPHPGASGLGVFALSPNGTVALDRVRGADGRRARRAAAGLERVRRRARPGARDPAPIGRHQPVARRRPLAGCAAGAQPRDLADRHRPAVMEGIAFDLVLTLEHLRAAGAPARLIRAGGGGARRPGGCS